MRKQLLFVTVLVACLYAGCGSKEQRIQKTSLSNDETAAIDDYHRSLNYLSPTAITKSPDKKTLYIACRTGRKVLYVDVATCRVTKTIPVANELTGIGISPDGKTLYVSSASATGEVYAIDVKAGKISETLRAGHTPMSPRVTPDGKKLFVCNRFDNSVSVFDTAPLKKLADIQLPPREPVGLAITPKGKRVVVVNHLNGDAIKDYTGTKVTIIDAVKNKILKTFVLANGSNSAKQVAISHDGQWAYIPHILSSYQLPTTQIERGWMNTNAMAIVDIEKMKYYNTVLLDDVDRGAANPWAVRVSWRWIVVTLAGTHEVCIIDRQHMHDKLWRVERGQKVSSVSDEMDDVPNDLSFLVYLSRRVRLEGRGPRALELVYDRAFVPDYFTDRLSVVDLVPVPRSHRLGPEVKMDDLRRGEMLFHDADLCFQKWQSCCSCHPDARENGLVWDLLSDGMGNPRSVKSLLFSHETPPVMITGVRPNAETAVRGHLKHILFAVRPEGDAKALDAYLRSLRPVPSPHLVNGKLSESAMRGKKVFEEDASCGKCHSGKYFTDMKKHHIGLLSEIDKHHKRTTEFDTPTLREIWRTSPYLFDGRAGTIMEVLTKYNPKDQHGKTSHLTKQQLQDLAKYVLSL